MPSRRSAWKIRIGMAAKASLLAMSLYGASSLSVLAEEPERAGAPIWVLQDEDTTIFLSGTAQLLPPDLRWRSAAFEDALARADQVVLEADRSSPQAQAQLQQTLPQLGIYTDGRTLDGVLTEDQLQTVSATAEQLGAPIQALAQLKPWLAAFQLTSLHILRLGHQTRDNVNSLIAAEAAAAGIPVRYLETALDLPTALSNLSENIHVDFLLHTVRGIEEDPLAHETVARAWASGDLDRLAEFLHGEGQWAHETIYDAFVVQRNKEWVIELKRILEEETGVVLFAVGIGHFVGDDSLLRMLAQDGLNVMQK